jgi:hypothetical protein
VRVSLGVTFSPWLTAPPPPAQVTSSAANAFPFQTIVVTGTNFGPNESVALFWDSAATAPLTTTTASAAGTITTRVAVPQAPAGAHMVLAVGLSSGDAASTIVAVRPWLLLVPASGRAGSQTAVSGFGFGALEQVTLGWDNPAQTAGVATTNALGTFYGTAAVTLTVPLAAPPGPHTVVGVGARSQAAGTGTFRVTP